MIKYNKPEPQLKRGICSFTSCEVTRSCSKAASGLPLEFALLKASCYITWRIGRVRTNTVPLDRREPPDHLPFDRPKATESLGGLVEPEP